MQAVSPSLTVTPLKEKPVSLKKVDRKLTELQAKLDELAKAIFEIKQVYFWRTENKTIDYTNVILFFNGIRELIEGNNGIYTLINSISDYSGILSRLRKVALIQLQFYRFEKTLGLVQSIEQTVHYGPFEAYQTLREMVITLHKIKDPSLSFKDKIILLHLEMEKNHLDFAENSPRDLGIELLKLLEMAFSNLVDQMQEVASDNSSMVTLLDMQKSVSDRVHSIEAHVFSGQKEREHVKYPDISPGEVQAVFDDMNKTKPVGVISNLVTNIFSKVMTAFGKDGESKYHKKTMETELGQKIKTLGATLDAKAREIIAGVNVNKAQFRRELNILGHCFMDLQSGLKQSRTAIYNLNVDDNFEQLLQYAHGLRYELSEIGDYLDVLKGLSEGGAVDVFSACTQVESVFSSAKKGDEVFASAYSLLQAKGKIISLEKKFQNKAKRYSQTSYSAFLHAIMDTVHKTCDKTLSQMLQDKVSHKRAKLLWESLFYNRPLDAKSKQVLMKQFLTISSCKTGDSEHFFLCYLYRHAVTGQNLLQQDVPHQVITTAEICETFDKYCLVTNSSEVLHEADAIFTSLKDCLLERNVGMLAKAFQQCTEFSLKKFGNSSLQKVIIDVLNVHLNEVILQQKYPKCKLFADGIFEKLSIALFAKSAREKNAAVEYIIANYDVLKKGASPDVAVLLERCSELN